jgi:16S rRNA G966 N2-methylase RsmD
MPNFPLADIWVSPKRQRTYFADAHLANLSESISGPVGLLHPPVIRPDGMLLAGETRLRVIRDLAANGIPITHNGQEVPLGQIPVTFFTGADHLSQQRVEFDENDVRMSLTWQERAQAIARLHEHLAGSLTDTAKATFNGSVGGTQVQTIKQFIAVSAHLHRADIAKAATLEDAYTILQREEERTRLTAAGKIIQSLDQNARHQLHHANCVDFLSTYSGPPFKCVITDPPYGINAETAFTGLESGRGQHHYNDSWEHWRKLMPAVLAQLFRVTSEESHCWLFCDLRRFDQLAAFATTAGFWCYPFPVIRQYGGGAGRVYPKANIRRDYDCLLFCMRGARGTRNLGADVILGSGKIPAGEKLDFGPQKPISIYTELLKRSATVGDWVLDPFGGSGTLIPAAHAFGARAFVIEQDPAAFGLCTERLVRTINPPSKDF